MAAGHDVVVVDNYVNSQPEALHRVEEIAGRPVKAYKGDVCDRAAMDKIFSENRFDAVIHFAGLKAVGESVHKPLEYYRNNLDTTLTLLEVMAEFGCRRLVFSSSATVYGGESPSPLTEDMPVGQCTNPYGRTKYFIEELLRDAAAAEPELSWCCCGTSTPSALMRAGASGSGPTACPTT